MKSELIMDPSSTTTTPNTWNPYNTLPTKTVSSSSLNGYSTSSSPLDNGSNNTSSSSDSGVDNSASKISSSLIPENGEINKSDERFFASNQNQTSVVNATSNSDGTSTASSDLSSLSASSSPPYRSPPSSSYLSASSSLYAAAAAAAHSNYGLYATANHHHPYVPQQQGYHGFGAFDFNNPYYTSPNLSTAIHEQFKLTPLIKNEFDYRYQNSNKQELEKSSSPEVSSQQLNETNNTTTSPQLSHQQYPTPHHPIAYYNNMSLSSPVAPNMSHPYHQYPSHHHPHHHQIMQHVAAAAAASSSSATSPPVSIQTQRKSEPNNVYSSTPAAYSLPPTVSSSSSSTNSTSGKQIKIKLAESSLWRQFNQIGTEMIITKSGRRMFPPLKVNVTGLESTKKYIMVVDIIPADDNRYKYHNGEWQITGKAEMPFCDRRYYNHPDSPLTGSQWTKQVISFHKLKLTNYVYDKHNIVLNSMHRYLPRLSIYEVDSNLIHTHVLTDCAFMAVTAYQNDAITKLKIEHNPFAKGFRDGQSRKPKRTSDDENESLEDRGSYSQHIQQQEQPPNKMSRVQSSEGPLCPKDMNKYSSSSSLQLPQSHINMHSQLDQQQHHLNYHQYQQHLEHLSQLQSNPYSKFNQVGVNSSSALKLDQNQHLGTEAILFGC